MWKPSFVLCTLYWRGVELRRRIAFTHFPQVGAQNCILNWNSGKFTKTMSNSSIEFYIFESTSRSSWKRACFSSRTTLAMQLYCKSIINDYAKIRTKIIVQNQICNLTFKRPFVYFIWLQLLDFYVLSFRFFVHKNKFITAFNYLITKIKLFTSLLKKDRTVSCNSINVEFSRFWW